MAKRLVREPCTHCGGEGYTYLNSEGCGRCDGTGKVQTVPSGLLEVIRPFMSEVLEVDIPRRNRVCPVCEGEGTVASSRKVKCTYCDRGYVEHLVDK